MFIMPVTCCAISRSRSSRNSGPALASVFKARAKSFFAMAFSILVLGYDTVWGVGGRPTWITQARTYPFINASSEAMVKMIADRRNEAVEAEAKALKQKH